MLAVYVVSGSVLIIPRLLGKDVCLVRIMNGQSCMRYRKNIKKNNKIGDVKTLCHRMCHQSIAHRVPTCGMFDGTYNACVTLLLNAHSQMEVDCHCSLEHTIHSHVVGSPPSMVDSGCKPLRYRTYLHIGYTVGGPPFNGLVERGCSGEHMTLSVTHPLMG